MKKTCRYFPLSYVLTLVFTVCTIHIYKYMYPWLFPTYTRIHIDTKVGPDIHVFGDTNFGKVAGFKSYLCHADGWRTINSSQCGCRGAFGWMEVPQHTRSTLDILQGLRRKFPNMFLKKYHSFEFRIMSFVQSFDAVFQGRFCCPLSLNRKGCVLWTYHFMRMFKMIILFPFWWDMWSLPRG